MAGRYQHPHTLNWATTIASSDAYVFVTQRVTAMLDELTTWASALKTLRQPASTALTRA